MAELGKKAQRRRRGRPNRSNNKMPSKDELKLCTAYLYRKDGCSREDDCNSLHICRHYILQSCRAGSACKFSHDLSGRQPQALFRRQFGIEHLINGQSLHKFRELFAATLRKPPTETSDQEERGDSGIEPQEKLMNFLLNFEHADETSSQDIYYDDNEDCSKGKEPCGQTTQQARPWQNKQPKICSFFVGGVCKFTSHLGFRHCSSPYQWQIRDGRRSDWLDLTRQPNDVIEEQFCDVKNGEFSGAILACSEENMNSVFYKVTITFGMEPFGVINNNKNDRVLDVRRLSTVSEAQPGRPRKGHSTLWTWYWQDTNQNWIEFPNSDSCSPLSSSLEIERKYLKFEIQKGSPQLDVTTKLGECQIDFSQMELTSPALDYTHPLARRPKWKPSSGQGSCDGQSNPVGRKGPNESSAPKKSSIRTRKLSRGGLQDTRTAYNSEVGTESLLGVPRETDMPPSKKASSVQKDVSIKTKKAESLAHPSASSDTGASLSSEEGRKTKFPKAAERLSKARQPVEPGAQLLASKKPKALTDDQSGEQLASFLKARASDLGDHEEPVLQESSMKPQESTQVVRPKTRNPSGPSQILPLISSTSETTLTKDSQPTRRPDQKEFTYICPYFLRGRCIYQDDKYTHKRHFPTPYHWQFLDTRVKFGADWEDFPSADNDYAERSFCDVQCTGLYTLSGASPIGYIFFEGTRMYGETIDIPLRRLSTSSSILKSNWENAFCTEWIWYWQDETEKWIVYSEQNAKGLQAGIDSATIEEKFVDYERKNGESVINFTAGTQQYTLDFTAMKQTNVLYGTCREVRRRPKFVAMDERKILAKELSKAQTGGVVVPTTWDNRGTQTEMKLVRLTDYTSPEYTIIANLFWDTMDNKGTIVSIKRIQNLELWEDFYKTSERMKKKNGGKAVRTEQLFHGTTSKKYASAICSQNFDWRLSGSNVGTRYGKGSYFARDAVFAHSYTKPDDLNHRYMFVAKVLVGTYTTGQSEYTRPPPKDPRKPLEDLYDSCVNDMAYPKIYVIFEKNQVYPEYLIKYNEVSGYQPAPTPAPRSRVPPTTAQQVPFGNPYTTSSSRTRSQYATSSSRTQSSYATSSATSQNPYATSSATAQNPYATSSSRAQNPYATSSSTAQNPYATSSSRTQSQYTSSSSGTQSPTTTPSTSANSQSGYTRASSNQSQPKQSKCTIQ